MIDEKYKLVLLPIDVRTASLVRIDNNAKKNSIFNHAVKYEGHNNYKTNDILVIDKGNFDGRRYTITEIQEGAFSHCRNLKVLVIGQYVKKISWNMYGCTSLENIFVEKGNANYYDIDGVLFRDKELVAYPQGRNGSYQVPNGIVKIGNHAFKSSLITELCLPETLREIGINAFYECRLLKEVVLPKAIQVVAFNNNKANKPITVSFYLHDDISRMNPLLINDITKMFPPL